MPRAPAIRKWTDDDLAKLRQLFEQDATLLRAAAALRRATGSVQKKAKELGLLFPGTRAVRAGLRASGALTSEK
jgi:hypothetical protein